MKNNLYYDNKTNSKNSINKKDNECADKIRAGIPKPVIPKKVSYEDAVSYAMEKDKDLQCGDFNGAVNVIHQDGSTFHFNYAISEYYDRYLIVFTEHNRFHIFYKDDLTEYSEWTRKQLTFKEE